VKGPLKSTGQLPFMAHTGKFLRRSTLFFPKASLSRGDGDYRFALDINGYSAKPVVISVENGIPSTDRIEFQMPCTKAETLQSAESKDQE
jgi:hypothetical protein